MDKTSSPVLDTAIQLGSLWEAKVSEKLLELGIPNERMFHNDPYDIQAGQVKIEVKFCGKSMWHNNRQTTPSYRFEVRKKWKGEYADFFVCCISDDTMFVIPSRKVKKVNHIYISYPFTGRSRSPFHQFINRFDLIQEKCNAEKTHANPLQ
jgi:hypothetical protein